MSQRDFQKSILLLLRKCPSMTSKETIIFPQTFQLQNRCFVLQFLAAIWTEMSDKLCNKPGNKTFCIVFISIWRALTLKLFAFFSCRFNRVKSETEKNT